MTFTALLDVAIGLSLLYLGAALFVTVALESFEGIRKSRCKTLKASLEVLLGKDGLKKVADSHPALKGVEEEIRSYVDPVVLAQTLMQVAKDLPEGSAVRNAIAHLEATYSAKVGEVTKEVGLWVDRSLTMLGESYKRWRQLGSFLIGMAIAIVFNVDTVSVTSRLYRDKDLRDSVSAAATELVQKASPDLLARCQKLDVVTLKADKDCAPIADLALAVAKRDGTFGQLPIGWRSWQDVTDTGPAQWVLRAIGWLLTGLAVSIGAPFWFDLLTRFVNIRSGQRKPELAANANK